MGHHDVQIGGSDTFWVFTSLLSSVSHVLGFDHANLEGGRPHAGTEGHFVATLGFTSLAEDECLDYWHYIPRHWLKDCSLLNCFVRWMARVAEVRVREAWGQGSVFLPLQDSSSFHAG